MNMNEMLGVDVSIIQAPMAGVQDWRLAAAVSDAGGLGSIPCGMLSTEQICAEIEQFIAYTNRPFNLNFFCHQVPSVSDQEIAAWIDQLSPYYQEAGLEPEYSAKASRMPFSKEAADAIEKYAPPVMSFHFGLPEPDLLARVKAWGATVLSSATTVEEGIWLAENGADVVIAQGVEAGGHRGMFLTKDLETQLDTKTLVAKLSAELSIPVIAAGGIADQSDIKDMLGLGAQGVQIGTTYLLCDEAKTSDIHRGMLQRTDIPTAITNLFSGRPARGIRNRVMQDLGDWSEVALAFPFSTQAITPLRSYAESKGLGDFTPLWSGENRFGCKAISAKDLTVELSLAFKA
ncbi:NAD(P)H-dependent flavin oxidoreductase [Neptuniibacter sp. QD72_48]|uniref:NAD(P)H-dependent flavin oxidoreductase n=1 Tax=unclassified Neptuniibacter TaxID=2630693 RepID=UPI0039F467C7